MRRGNKGEWSELYTFLTLLSVGKIHAADANLDKMDDIYYPLIKVLRSERNKDFQYIYTDKLITIQEENSKYIATIPVDKFKENSLLVLKRIKNSKGRSFSIPDVEVFLDSIKYETLKAKTTAKSDIHLKVYDQNTGMSPILGFSIKSQLGNAPTLLNAGKTTNFIYRITGNINDEDMKEINNINDRSKIRSRVKAIEKKGFLMDFIKVSTEMFNLNLQIIDSRMPNILAALLEGFYSGKGTSMKELLEHIQIKNPCNFNDTLGHDFYEYKIKSFMRDVALGMVPSKTWAGKFDATGGYIIVREDGEIVCYHIYNHNEFQEYLLQNVKFETPSSSRHDFGKIYKIEGKYFINLNLQLRFI